MKLLEMMQRLDLLNQKDPDFLLKYENLSQYFRVRFGLVTSMIGEDLIQGFIIKNEERQQNYFENQGEQKKGAEQEEQLDVNQLFDFDFGIEKIRTPPNESQRQLQQ